MNNQVLNQTVEFIEANPDVFNMSTLLRLDGERDWTYYLENCVEMPAIHSGCIAGIIVYNNQELAQELYRVKNGNVGIMDMASELLQMPETPSAFLFLGIWNGKMLRLHKIVPEMAIKHLKEIMNG